MPNQELATIEQELQAQALALQNQIQATGNYISTKNKIFTTPDGVTGEELSVVILGFAFRNEYYDGPYVANNPVPPVCFSVGEVANEMTPNENGNDLQSDTTCSACPMFQWGSSPVGAGKACKQQIIVAVIAPGTPSGEIMLLKVSPTSLKGFNTYMAQTAAQYGHPIRAITNISFVPDKAYPSLVFAMGDENMEWKEVWPRLNEAKNLVLQVPQHNYEEEQTAAPAPRAAAKPRRAKKKTKKARA